jgi:GAF domain-containing protein
VGALRHGQEIFDALIPDPASPRIWVPIRMDSEAVGHLYVTEPLNSSGFSSEDETLATVMSITASGAIANAHRLAESEQRRRWLVAAAKLSNRLLVRQADEPLEVITDAAAVAADAGVVTVAGSRATTKRWPTSWP